jgi:hypothetical protein
MNCDDCFRRISWYSTYAKIRIYKPGVLVVSDGEVADTRIATRHKFTIDSHAASHISEIYQFEKCCQQRRAAQTEI